VELFLNGQSLGRKIVKPNSVLDSVLSWPVKYAPGTLLARGYKKGAEVLTSQVETTGEPAAVHLRPHKTALRAGGQDVSIIAVQVSDAQERLVPTASNPIAFDLAGPGRIIGVGNGDPASHEADQYVPKSAAASVVWRVLPILSVENRPEAAPDFDDSSWQSAFGPSGGRGGRGRGAPAPAPVATNIYRGSFDLPDTNGATVSLLLRDLGEQQWIYLNGQPVARNVARDAAGHQFDFDSTMLRSGKNVIAIVATPMAAARGGRGGQAAPARGNPAVVKVTTLAEGWKRNLFNGLAQVIVQSTGQPGEITLTATSGTLTPAVLKLQSQAPNPQSSERIYFAPDPTGQP